MSARHNRNSGPAPSPPASMIASRSRQDIGGLRILTVMNCPGSHASGMPTANASLSRQLRALGCTVDHLYLEDYPQTARRPSLNYLFFGLLSVPIIRRYEAARGPYDVIQISGGDGYLSPLLRRDHSGRRRLIVARCHGLEHRYWEAFRRELSEGHVRTTLRHRMNFGLLRLNQVRWAIRNADLLNCHTEADAEFAISRRWKEPSQVAVLPSGIEPAWFETPLASKAPGKRIIFCGSWTWMKGARVLVRIFDALGTRDPGITLTIVGSGTGKATVLKAFPPSLRGRVTVKPALPHSKVHAEFQRHDLLLATSMFEGFGTVVIEAMAAGLPVVAADVGGASDYVRPPSTGYRVRPGDTKGFVDACLALLSASPADLLTLRREAREAVSHLTWDRVAVATLAAYQDALARLAASAGPR